MRFTKTSLHYVVFTCLILVLSGCASKPERKVNLPSWVDIYGRYDEDGNRIDEEESESEEDTEKEEDYQPESAADASDKLKEEDVEEAPKEKKASSLFEFFTGKKDLSDETPEEAPAEESKESTSVDESTAPAQEVTDTAKPDEPKTQEPNATDTIGTSDTTEQVVETAPAEPAKPVIPRPKALAAKNEKHAQEAQSARGDYQEALELLKDGHEQDALLLFQELSARYPTLAGPAINQAIILRKQGKLDLAKSVLQKALLNKTQNPYLMTELGLVYRELGNFEAAKQSYLAAIRIEPNYDKAHYNLGVLADLYLHDPALAAQEFEAYQALQEEPNKKVAGWLKEINRRIK